MLVLVCMVLFIRLVSISTAVSGISNIEGKKKLLIVPSVLCLLVIIGLSTFVVTESIAYLFDIGSLKHVTEIIRNYLGQP